MRRDRPRESLQTVSHVVLCQGISYCIRGSSFFIHNGGYHNLFVIRFSLMIHRLVKRFTTRTKQLTKKKMLCTTAVAEGEVGRL